MAKIEKPAAIENLDEIVALADGVMVARGDLGVELPPEEVPLLQKRIVRAARAAGKPVVVATQMLESMIERAGADPRRGLRRRHRGLRRRGCGDALGRDRPRASIRCEAVTIMDRIIGEVEHDPDWRSGLEASHTPAERNTPDAICCGLRRVAGLLNPAATVAFTTSGFSCLRASRERPVAPIIALTPQLAIARRLALVWGVHPVASPAVNDVAEMVDHASAAALEDGIARRGDTVVVIAGLPFGERGNTNLLHVAQIG